jgi:glycosyltransferase involved in cell wall biosynthesis
MGEVIMLSDTGRSRRGDGLRVLLAAEHGEVGSAEMYAFDLAIGLASRSNDVHVIAFPAIETAAREAVGRTDVGVDALPEDPRVRFSKARGLIARFRPNVVHVNQPASPVLIAALTKRVPTRIITDHVLPKQASYNRRGRTLHELTRLAATDVLVFSRQNAEVAGGVWGRLPVTVIHPGIKRQACSASRDAIRRDLGLDPDDYVVCNVARLSIEQKQQDVLIRAIAMAHRHDGTIRAVLVGAGPDEPNLRGLIRSLGVPEVVRFAGHRADVACVLQASDVYVHPSSWEGLGFAVVEAMAMGLPVIGSDISVMREVVGDSGAPLVGVGDVNGLARAIGEMKSSGRAAALGASLQSRWEAEFTVEQMVLAHEGLYRQRAGRSPRGERLA